MNSAVCVCCSNTYVFAVQTQDMVVIGCANISNKQKLYDFHIKIRVSADRK